MAATVRRQWNRAGWAKTPSVLAVLAMAWAGAPDASLACNVPAFRYALERWPADAYQVLVYHEAGQPGAGFEFLKKGAAGRGAANYALRDVDVSKPEGKALAGQRGIAAFPWVEIHFPVSSQIRTPVWSGPLIPDRARRIVNSPGRSRLAQALLGGAVAVWVLIKSGRAEKDRRALESLKTHLDWASANLRIPNTGTDASGNPIEVKDFETYPVRFELMEIARDDPNEELLVSALLRSEPDLEAYGEPLAFPVFGRGRALYALVGDGIERRNIREACQSMLAWCSCEIKAQNPGTDLLIAADWSRPYGGRMVKEPELPLTGLDAFLPDQKTPAEPALPPRPSEATMPAASGAVPMAAPAKDPPAGESLLARNLLYLAAAVGAALVGLSVLLKVKARR